MYASVILWYVILMYSAVMLLDSLRFILKIKQKTFNEQLFEFIILSINPFILTLMFVLKRYSCLFPKDFELIFEQLKGFSVVMELQLLLHNLDSRYFNEYVIGPFWLLVLFIVLPVFEYIKPVCQVNMGLHVIFYCISIVYIILMWYYNNKKEQDYVENDKIGKMGK